MKKKSIITDYCDISTFSGKPNPVCHHTIFGSGLRELADEDKLTIFVTNEEHNCSPYGTLFQIHENPTAEKLSKMVGQLAWEKEYLAKELEKQGKDLRKESREQFMKRYGQSYL